MKLSATILAFYLTALMIFPAGELTMYKSSAAVTHSCCKKDAATMPAEEHPEQAPKNSCCDKGICNPFMSCCCCAYYHQAPDYRIVAYTVLASPAIPEVNSYYSSFTGSCFHPPEVNIVFS